MKMTFQPKKRQRSKVHGFRARMSSCWRQKSISSQKSKRKKEIIRIGRSFVAYFLYGDRFHEIYAVVEKEPAVPGGLQKRRFPRQQVFGHVCIGESSG